MQETREEKLRRWLEEKKAAKRAEQEQRDKQQGSAMKRGLQTPSTGSRTQSSVRAPSTATTATTASKEFSTLQKASAEFSRFSEQATPVGRTQHGKAASKTATNELKTPVGRSTASAASTADSSVTQESLDRKRRVLEHKTLVPTSGYAASTSSSVSKRAAPTASASKERPSTVRKQLLTGADDHRNNDGERDSFGGSLSARRRQAISRGTSTSASSSSGSAAVNLQDLAQLREHLAALETVLLQWNFINHRLERALEKRRAAAQHQLLAVWSSLNEQRSAALKQSIIGMREQQARQLHTQLAVQYEHLLPLQPIISEFCDCFTQLADTVYSTAHALPVQGADAVVDETALQNELAVVEKSLPDADTEKAQNAVQYANDVSRLAAVVKAEFDLLLKCRKLLSSVELQLCQKRSLLIEQLQAQKDTY